MAYFEQLGQIFSSTPDAMFVLGREPSGEFAFEAVNPAGERLGLEQEKVRGKPPKECMPMQQAEDLAARCLCCIDTGETIRYEVQGLLNKESTFEVQLVPLRGPDGKSHAVAGIARDVTLRRRAEALRELQSVLVERIASAVTLPEILEEIVRRIEDQSPGMHGSILLLEGKRLRPGAAPNLPEGYTKIIDGLEIGPMVGSCGTAAFVRKRTVVTDINTDPLWAPFKELPLGFGLQACWSEPIFSQRGKVLGTFAMYYNHPRSPSSLDLQLIETAAKHAAIAIERHRAMAELRERDIQLRLSIDAARMGTWLWDIPTGSVRWSESAERIFGQSPGSFKGTQEAYRRLVFAADLAKVDAAIADALEGKVPSYQVQHRIALKDGQIRWVEARGEVFRDASGKPARMAGVVHEITERKRAEQDLLKTRCAVDNAADEFFWLSTDGVIQDANDMASERLGYTRAELLKVGLPTIIPEFAGAHWQEFVSELRRNKRKNFEAQAITSKGKTHPIDVSANFFDYEGEEFIFCAVRDVTERKELEAQLRQSQKMEGIGQLAGGVAHDFNNLLTVISSAVGLLQEDLPAGHPSISLVDEIGKAGERASSLTKQLLAFSRKQVLKLQVLDLNHIVSGMEKMLKRLIGEDIRLSTRLDPTLLKIKADGAQLEHVIVNLAVNARDAMPKGGGLTLSTGNEVIDEHQLAARPELAPGNYAVLSVTDTGTGIPPEVMARIFEPFFTTKQPGKGTGLGLATVYGVLKQLGGFVSVESTVGKGTTFKLHLPSAELGASVSSGPDVLPPDPGGKGEIVLLVEDDDMVRALESQVLRRRGYVVLEARDGLEALQISRSHEGPIHLLATDVVMPHMNGRELAEQLGQKRPSLKVLFLSGHTEDATLRAGLVEEKVVLLEKPFVPDTLARKVSEVLQH